MREIKYLALSVSLLLCILGCQDDPSTRPTTLPTVTMKIGGEDFTLEVADTYSERKKGLMLRESMPHDHGMLFVFDEDQELSFWMRNTLIPLDILYVNATGKVVSIKQMKPMDESGVPSNGLARYAIELNQGSAARVGVKAGDALQLPDLKEPGGQ